MDECKESALQGNYKLPILGLRGRMGAGKDSLASEICACFPGYSIRKFATILREAVTALTHIPPERTVSDADKAVDLSGRCYRAEVLRHRLAHAIQEVTGSPPAPRVSVQMLLILTGEALYVPEEDVKLAMTVGRLLQVLGTECFRAFIGPNVWVDAFFLRWEREGRPPVVIADTRFPNEAEAVRDRGGVVLLVQRPNALRIDGRSEAHASELALDTEEPDVKIDNSGELAALGPTFLRAWPLILRTAAERSGRD